MRSTTFAVPADNQDWKKKKNYMPTVLFSSLLLGLALVTANFYGHRTSNVNVSLTDEKVSPKFSVTHFKPHYQCGNKEAGRSDDEKYGCAERFVAKMKILEEKRPSILVVNEMEVNTRKVEVPKGYRGIGFVCEGSFKGNKIHVPTVAFIDPNVFDFLDVPSNSYQQKKDEGEESTGLPFFDTVDFSQPSSCSASRSGDTRALGMMRLLHKASHMSICFVFGTLPNSKTFDKKFMNNDFTGLGLENVCTNPSLPVLYVIDGNFAPEQMQTISRNSDVQFRPTKKCSDPFVDIATDNRYFYDRIAMCTTGSDGNARVSNTYRDPDTSFPENHQVISADVTFSI